MTDQHPIGIEVNGSLETERVAPELRTYLIPAKSRRVGHLIGPKVRTAEVRIPRTRTARSGIRTLKTEVTGDITTKKGADVILRTARKCGRVRSESLTGVRVRPTRGKRRTPIV